MPAHLGLTAVSWPCRQSLLVGALLCAVCSSAHAAYSVELDADAPTELKALLVEHLDLFRYRDREDVNADQLNFMMATAAEQVVQLSSTEGYFSPKTSVDAEQRNDRTHVRLHVNAGQQTVVAKLAVEVTGSAAAHSPRQVERVKRNWPLLAGMPFRQADWGDAKQAGLDILQARRYPAARIVDSSARIDADSGQAELAVDYDSGPLFRLGELAISGTRRYPQDIVRNVSRLQAGEEYSVDRLLEFQRQILRTPYFSNVVVDIGKDTAQAAQAPVNVRVTEYPTQRIRGGLGYTTDTGVHLDGRYSHNDVFDQAWALSAQTRLERHRQLGALELALPPDPGAWVRSLHGSTERTTLEGIDLRSRRLGARRTQTSDNEDLAYSLEYYLDSLERIDGSALPLDMVVQPGTHRALVAGVEKTWRRIDDRNYPRRGRILSLQAGLAWQGLLSDQNFFRFYGRLQQYLPVPASTRDLVILRAELGAVASRGDNAAIPASLLFRAGGAESVRGYAYQSIGNTRNGTVYPARYLAAGGIEYQHWLLEQWGGAVFYDAGVVTDRWRERSMFDAIGIGARWRSPVGRLGVDLAYGFRDKRLRPHLSLGVAF